MGKPLIVLAGQSNAQRLSSDVRNALDDTYGIDNYAFVQVSQSGAALTRDQAGQPDWHGPDDLRATLYSEVETALTGDVGIDRISMIWAQGEADTHAQSPAQVYQDDLTALFTEFRTFAGPLLADAGFGDANINLVISELAENAPDAPDREGWSGIIAAQKSAGFGDDRIVSVDPGQVALDAGLSLNALFGDGRLYAEPFSQILATALVQHANALFDGISYAAESAPPPPGPVADHLIGTEADDDFEVDHTGDTITETAASTSDHVYASVSFVLRDHGSNLEHLTLTGGDAIDGTGNSLDNAIAGNSNDNNINAAWGDDIIHAGSGGDTIFGSNGDDTIHGQDGDDSLNGGDGADILFGGNGDDTLNGNAGADQLFGNAGADVMNGGENADIYFVDGDDIVVDSGPSGYDKAQINAPGGANLNLAEWAGVERVNGFTGDDNINGSSYGESFVLFGHAGDDALFGSAFDDTILGGSGKDNMFGGAGDDILIAGSGADLVDGGEGDDTYFIMEDGNMVIDTGSGGNDVVVVVNYAVGISLGVADWIGVERIVGYTGNDTINAGDNAAQLTILGGAGSDMLSGGSANDTLYGGTGDDILTGNDGNDAIMGGSGNDWLTGGGGNDFLKGEGGTDVFVFADGFGRDVLKDFSDGTELIDFSAHSTINSISDLTISQDGAHTIISVNGATDQITLADFDATDLEASDFLF